MGNRYSHRVQMARSSTMLVHTDRKLPNKDDEIRKSKSLNELSRQTSMRNGQNRSCTRGSLKPTAAGCSPSTANRSLSRNKSFRRDAAHPISAQGREIIVSCLDNPHTDLGNRICMRVYERRDDYQRFIQAVGREKWTRMTNELREFLEEIVLKIDDLAVIDQLSRKYGEEHVELRSLGFKPDFWVSLADAMTVECVILDMANHQPTDTVAAWSQLVTLMFSSIRDGYYAALRLHRRSSRRILTKQSTIDSSKGTSSTTSREASIDAPSDSRRPRTPLLMSSQTIQQDSFTSSTPSPVNPSPGLKTESLVYSSQDETVYT